MAEHFYIYNAQDIAVMLDGLLAQLIVEKDLERFDASCKLIEFIIFRAREDLWKVMGGDEEVQEN